MTNIFFSRPFFCKYLEEKNKKIVGNDSVFRVKVYANLIKEKMLQKAHLIEL